MEPRTPPIIELDNVGKRFGAVQALDGVSLQIGRGEIVAFLGPNGAGKTTAISIMLGIRRAGAGSARLFGLDPRDVRARSRVGVMLQESGVPESLKVSEIIDLFRSYYPAPLRRDEVIRRAGLGEKAGALIASLSGGQKQRLFFALAIAGDPDLIVLDEPTTGMDVESRRAFWAQVRGFAASGKTIVLSTHYLEEADALASRVLVIDRGRIIADGTPAAVRSQVGGKQVTFDHDGRLDEAILARLPVASAELTAGSARLLTSEPEAVLAAIFAAGITITNLAVSGADLEEAFLTLTSKEARPVLAAAGPAGSNGSSAP